MATALITTFFEAKMKNAKTSIALYSVSSDVDGAKIVQQMGIRWNKAIVKMPALILRASDQGSGLVAWILHAAVTGVSRSMLESRAPEKDATLFIRN